MNKVTMAHSPCVDHVAFVTGGLSVAVEGPSRADITCQDNKDGTCSVTYLPVLPGEYKVIIKFADKHINGSPFTAKITGEGKKRNQISVGTASEISLMVHETDVRNLTGTSELKPQSGADGFYHSSLFSYYQIAKWARGTMHAETATEWTSW